MPLLKRTTQDDGKVVLMDLFYCSNEMEESLPSDRFLLVQDNVRALSDIMQREGADVKMFLTSGYPFKLEVNRHRDEESNGSFYGYWYYRTQDDRARHEGYFAWPDLHICTAAKQYDQRQYDLVDLLPAEWFSSDANLKGLAGLLCDNCASFGQARRTFACIVSAKCSDQFDLPEAMKAFGCGAGNETSFTEAQVDAIAGKTNPDTFHEWRAEQAKQEAGEQAKQETEAKQQRKDRRKAAASEDEPKRWVKQCETESKQRKDKKMTQKELKAALFKVLLDELERLSKSLIREDNPYVNTIAKQRKWGSPEQLAYAIKSVYGYITADNVPVYVKKSVTDASNRKGNQIMTNKISEDKQSLERPNHGQ